MKSTILKPISESIAKCNGRIKMAQDGEILEVMHTSRPVFNWGDFESIAYMQKCAEKSQNSEENLRAKSRAYRRVFDLCACNADKLDLFVTLTLNPEKVDRYDIKEVYPKLQRWLDNRVRRKDMSYILVPERHKDGAIHFHGLINSGSVKLKDSGKQYWKSGPSRGKEIYNVSDWRIGFTTAVRLSGDYMAVCKYISKYVTKQSGNGLIGGRYYYHGGELKEPIFKYINFTSQPEGEQYQVDDAKLVVTYVSDLSKCQFEDAKIEVSRAHGAA